MMKFFDETIKTAEAIKRQYRQLVFTFHPDCGGTDQDMKEINKEYEDLFKKYGNVHEKIDGTTYTVDSEESPIDDGYREMINKIAYLIKLGSITLELCGSWLWVGGNTKEYKDVLKKTGYKWSANKKMWYWTPSYKKKYHGKNWSMSDIRSTYGSKAIDLNGSTEPCLN